MISGSNRWSSRSGAECEYLHEAFCFDSSIYLSASLCICVKSGSNRWARKAVQTAISSTSLLPLPLRLPFSLCVSVSRCFLERHQPLDTLVRPLVSLGAAPTARHMPAVYARLQTYHFIKFSSSVHNQYSLVALLGPASTQSKGPAGKQLQPHLVDDVPTGCSRCHIVHLAQSMSQ